MTICSHTMRKTPLLRKTKLKRGTKRLSSVSPKRQAENRKYATLREKFLTAHSICQCCNRAPSGEVHHRKGREGKWLLLVEWWAALCQECHHRVHVNPAWAKQNGWILPRF